MESGPRCSDFGESFGGAEVGVQHKKLKRRICGKFLVRPTHALDRRLVRTNGGRSCKAGGPGGCDKAILIDAVTRDAQGPLGSVAAVPDATN